MRNNYGKGGWQFNKQKWNAIKSLKPKITLNYCMEIMMMKRKKA